MNKNYYVAIDSEAGWDCVRGIFLANNEEEVIQAIAEKAGRTVEFINMVYIIHLQDKITEI